MAVDLNASSNALSLKLHARTEINSAHILNENIELFVKAEQRSCGKSGLANCSRCLFGSQSSLHHKLAGQHLSRSAAGKIFLKRNIVLCIQFMVVESNERIFIDKYICSVRCLPEP